MSTIVATKKVIITGGTGYMGSRLIKVLLQRGHEVTALVRNGSADKVPHGAAVLVADMFDAEQLCASIPPGAVVVQLLGVAHPSPAKAKQFQDIDLRSVKASAAAAAKAGADHLIYVSVNSAPSKLMAAYQQVRKEGEWYCRQLQLNCTFLRPWYVLGPGHWWPLLFFPLYGIAEMIPAWRVRARQRALVTIQQMLNALVQAVEAVPEPLREMEIRDIRRAEVK
jgi:uncharacterized protein YbjT (DUF2867 family)